MNVSNVKLIFFREVRDQLRDRRTLFMIAVLPILLYPLLGLSLFQVAQFTRQQSTRVLVVGVQDVGSLPALFENHRFSNLLFKSVGKPELLELEFSADVPAMSGNSPLDSRLAAEIQVRAGKFDAALYFPPDFAARLDAFREAVRARASQHASGEGVTSKSAPLQVPSPEIIYSTANERSQIAHVRLLSVLHSWTEKIGDENLEASGISARAVRPFALESADVAGDTGHRGAAMWSKTLPVLLLIWALTGAFYPAVDLCAGEKERGTLETLLCSPADRSEIVVGKLLTVMIFSIVTAVLNLMSMGLTGWLVLNQLDGLELPPLSAVVALSVALVPIAALFSALCLAIAAFARSSKEGQYYLMPLLLVTMPLVVLPMSPGVELGLGTSLIPVTGVVLLLRCLLEGDYWRAVQFSPTVMAVTLFACLMSIRWAVEQFNSESVLFRGGERLDLRLWLRHLYRDRRPTPTVAAAVACGAIILVLRFFLGVSFQPSAGFSGFVRMALTTQVVVFLLPTLLFTVFLARSPRQTLLLRRPRWLAVPAAALLAVAIHPAANVLQYAVSQIYQVSESLRPALESMQSMFRSADLWTLILVIAVVPAICEELTFRGFILSGLRHLDNKWRAIFYSALLFGVAHGVLQQSLIACVMGVVIAYVAVQSGSILPGVVFHLIHNSLAVLNSRMTPETLANVPVLRTLATPGEGGGCAFAWPVAVVSSLIALAVLIWFARQSNAKSVKAMRDEIVQPSSGQDDPLAIAGS